jgi:hypothetical protein
MTEDQKRYCANFYPDNVRRWMARVGGPALFAEHAFGPWTPTMTAVFFEDRTPPVRVSLEVYRRCSRCGHTEHRDW